MSNREDYERLLVATARLRDWATTEQSWTRQLFCEVRQHLFDVHDVLEGWQARDAEALDVYRRLHDLADACPKADARRAELHKALDGLLPRVVGQSWGNAQQAACERIAGSCMADRLSGWIAERWLPELSSGDGALAVWVERAAERFGSSAEPRVIASACRRFATRRLIAALHRDCVVHVIETAAQALDKKHTAHVAGLTRLNEQDSLQECWSLLVQWLLECLRMGRRIPQRFGAPAAHDGTSAASESTNEEGFAPTLRPFLWWDPETPWLKFSTKELLGQTSLLPHQLRSNSLCYSPLGHLLCGRKLAARPTLTWLRIKHAEMGPVHWWLPSQNDTHGCTHPHCTDASDWLAVRVQRLVSTAFLRDLTYHAIRSCPECQRYVQGESCTKHDHTKPRVFPEWPEPAAAENPRPDIARSDAVLDLVQTWHRAAVADLLALFCDSRTLPRATLGAYRKLTVLFALQGFTAMPPILGLADGEVASFAVTVLTRADDRAGELAAAHAIEPQLRTLYEERRRAGPPLWKPISKKIFVKHKHQLRSALRAAIARHLAALERDDEPWALRREGSENERPSP
jgi:hypothetical protein